MIRGMNRDERDDDAERCDELSGPVEMRVDGGVDAVLGRAGSVVLVEAADWLERYECERVIGARSTWAGAGTSAELGTRA
jgi:hypothetical protein